MRSLTLPAFLVGGALAATMCVVPAARAQMAQIPTLHETRIVHSGRHDGFGNKATTVWQETVRADRSPWIRLHFGAVELGESSQLVIRSMEDGDTQVFNAEVMRYWENYSAYFNGDAVELELQVAGADKGVFVQIDRVTFSERPDPTVEDFDLSKSICGSLDDRVASNDPRVARLAGFSSGGFCTGWLIPNNAGASAGHCGEPDGNFSGANMQFDVPPSDPDGSANMPPATSQFPVDSSAVSFQAGGEGDDYAVFPVNPNTGTGARAHDGRGWFRLTDRVPADGTTLRVTGNGIDDDPPGTVSGSCDDGDRDCNSASLTQQTDTGPMDSLDGDAIEHEVDTMPANSGSPVIWEANGYAIAVHTNGGCDDIVQEYDNAGTWFGDGNLANAVQNYNPSNRYWVDADSPTILQFGTVIRPFLAVGLAASFVPDGTDLKIYTGTYPASGGNVFTAGDDGRGMIMTSVWGDAIIGN